MTQDIFLLIEHIQGQVSDISYIMAAAARDLAKNEGCGVVGILFGSGAEGLKESIAVDKVIYCDHPALAEFSSDAYKRTLISLLGEYSPRAILFGNTTLGADVSSSLASHQKFPIISSCIKISDSGSIISQICGGKIMVDSQLADKTTLITVNPGGYKPEEGQSSSPAETITFSAPNEFDRNDLFIEEMEHFINVINGQEEPVCSLDDGIKALELSVQAKVKGAR